MRRNSNTLHTSPLLILFMTAAWIVPSPLRASDFQSPRTAGLGGAGHAGPFLNDAIYLNPSFTSFNPFRSFSSNYLSHSSDSVSPSGQSTIQGSSYNFSILDGTADSLFQAGVGFTKRGNASMIHIGASKSVINRIGYGLGTKILLPAGTNSRLFDGSLAVSGIATDWFQASFIVDNLLQANSVYGFYREFVLGTKINLLSIVSVFLDPHWIPALPAGETFGYEAGLEFTMMSDFSLRFGSFKNSVVPFEAARGNGYSFGLGWTGPKISFDYGYTRALSPVPSGAHQFGLNIFF